MSKLLPVLTLAACSAAAAPASKCQVEAMDMPVTMRGSAPQLAAKINGRDELLLLDSGAFWSVITPAVAEELKLPLRATPFGFYVTGIGGNQSASITTVKSLGFAGMEIRNVDFIVTGSEVGGNSVGVLGENFLERLDVDYDFANGKVRLLKAKNCGNANMAYWLKQGDNYSVLDIQRINPHDPFPVGYATLNNSRIKVKFDTGAYTSMITRRAAEHAGVKLDSPGVAAAGFSQGIGRHQVKTYIAPFDLFKLGDGEEIHHTRLRVSDSDFGDLETDMLIGADFFLSHHVLVANSQHRVYFTYNGGAVFNLTAHAAPSEAGAPESEALPDADAYARRAAASEGRRDYERALADFSRAIEMQPATAEYYFRRGVVREELQNAAGAIEDFNHVIELQADHIPALVARAEMRIREHDRDAARQDLDTVDRLVPKQANVRMEIAADYEQSDLHEAAIVQYDDWIPSHRDDVRLSHAYGRRCWNRALLGIDLSEALKDCNKAESLAPKGGEAGIFASRGTLRLRMGDYDKAVSDFDAALKLNPKYAWALYGRGVAKTRKQKVAEGETDMKSAQEIAPPIAATFKARGLEP
jgi:tetratricopeptide (TPR) repeat protein/predicted aspartyl protease